MKQFLITVAGVFIGLLLFVIVTPLALLATVSAATRPAPVPAASILVLDLRGPLTDQETASPLVLIRGRPNSVMGIEEVLRAAGRDDKIKGLLVRLPEGGVSPAAADELRLAFLGFRAHGKTIYVHSQGLYADGTVVSTYELAAAANQIWMQPSSSFQVTGLAENDIFLKGLFDRFGVQPDYQQRYQYKTAVNPYLYSDYTPAHRQSELSWMDSVFGTVLTDVARDRGKDVKQTAALIVAGPYSAEDAKAKGLIDQVGQVKDAEEAILAKAGPGAKLVDFADYASRVPGLGAGAANGGVPTVAVIAAEGDIVTGTSHGAPSSPFSTGQTIYSDDVAKAFYDAIDARDVKAIVFRVSSPGGSDTASEQILAAVRAAKAAGKPVVVSMGTYAASGGYWISSQASEIVAEPATLTGSIGVFGGKFALGKALGRYGVDLRGLKVGGDYADSFSPNQPMSASQRAAFSAWMDRIYQGFVARVAEGRRLPVARVEEIARGRVWTGDQAKSLGLVDRLGGFYDAVDQAKALAGIRGSARLQSFTVETSPLEAIRRFFGASSQSARILAGMAGLLQTPLARTLASEGADARLRSDGATVLAPGLAP
jgi:protease-4